MNAAERHARAIRRRYRLRRPGDLDRVLAHQHLTVESWRFAGRVQEAIIGDVIGIAETVQDPRAVRELAAHALGHHLMHKGNQIGMLARGDDVVPWQWEQQAWAFAYELFMPARAVERLLRRGCRDEEMREYFEVSDEFYRERMRAFAAQHAEEIARDRSQAIARGLDGS